MHREDNSKYLLYIEPKAVDKLQEPINDELTEMMEKALTKSKKEKLTKEHIELNAVRDHLIVITY